MTDRPVDDATPRDPAGDGLVSDLTVDPATADSGDLSSPEQDVLVAGLLATLRDDDPPMPDDVVRRLDAVLAEERRARLESAGVASLPVAALSGTDGASGDPADLAPVTVLPDRAERRGPGMRSFKVLGGVAAAVALVATGAVIGTQGLSGGGSSTSSGGSTPVVAAAGVPVANSATTYSKSALEQQARDLVGSLRTRAYSIVTPEAVPQAAPPDAVSTDAAASESPAASASASASQEAADGQVTGTELAGCLQELTGAADVRPLVVDQGTYDGTPAEVLVLPSTDQPGAVDVWVVAAGCRAGSVELLDFRRLALATASPSS